jgi:hypothetical protein
MTEDRVRKGARTVTWPGVSDQAGRLVDDQNVMVFEDNVEQDVFGGEIRHSGTRDIHGDPLADFERLPSLGGWLAVYLDAATPDEVLLISKTPVAGRQELSSRSARLDHQEVQDALSRRLDTPSPGPACVSGRAAFRSTTIRRQAGPALNSDRRSHIEDWKCQRR